MPFCKLKLCIKPSLRDSGPEKIAKSSYGLQGEGTRNLGFLSPFFKLGDGLQSTHLSRTR